MPFWRSTKWKKPLFRRSTFYEKCNFDQKKSFMCFFTVQWSGPWKWLKSWFEGKKCYFEGPPSLDLHNTILNWNRCLDVIQRIIRCNSGLCPDKIRNFQWTLVGAPTAVFHGTIGKPPPPKLHLTVSQNVGKSDMVAEYQSQHIWQNQKLLEIVKTCMHYITVKYKVNAH